MLRQKGVIVIERQSDYSKAVKEGSKQSDRDPNMHFIDDENSTDLFLGYAVVASRLNRQLQELNIIVDKEHPLQNIFRYRNYIGLTVSISIFLLNFPLSLRGPL